MDFRHSRSLGSIHDLSNNYSIKTLIRLLGPPKVKCRLVAIFLNGFPAYFGKCCNLNYSISQNMLEIHYQKNALTLIKSRFDLTWTILESNIMSSSFKEVKISENHVTIYSRTKLFNTDKKVIANCLWSKLLWTKNILTSGLADSTYKVTVAVQF